jgi:hypothetical protein
MTYEHLYIILYNAIYVKHSPTHIQLNRDEKSASKIINL